MTDWRYQIDGDYIAPTWFALITKPQKEAKVRSFFGQRGLPAFFPSEWREVGPQSRRRKYEAPLVTRYVFVMFRKEPHWHKIAALSHLFSGVVSDGVWPKPIPVPVIEHLQGMTVEAERLREARRELLRVREGDKAIIRGGPLGGFLCGVSEVVGQIAELDLPFGARVKADLADLERVIPDVETVPPEI